MLSNSVGSKHATLFFGRARRGSSVTKQNKTQNILVPAYIVERVRNIPNCTTSLGSRELMLVVINNILCLLVLEKLTLTNTLCRHTLNQHPCLYTSISPIHCGTYVHRAMSSPHVYDMPYDGTHFRRTMPLAASIIVAHTSTELCSSNMQFLARTSTEHRL